MVGGVTTAASIIPQVRRPRVAVLTSPTTPPLPNRDRLEQLADLTLTDAPGLGTALRGAEVLLLWDFFSGALQEHWESADALEWAHVAAAGVDALIFPALQASSVVVTRSPGVFDRPIAEFVLGAVLAHDKQLLRSRELQQRHVWQHREVILTQGSTALVVGTGGIGRECARLLRLLGMHVRGVGRVARAADPDFGEVVASDDLARHVGWADHLVLAAPLTPATRGLVDAEVLAAMRPTAHLVNVGRGALVDEPALLAALRGARVAAATLDVFAVEPLPPEHPFWDLPQVAISAHMCGDYVGWRAALARVFEDNLGRWVRGEPLPGRIDLTTGYAARTPREAR